jgi:hypothetical protein
MAMVYADNEKDSLNGLKSLLKSWKKEVSTSWIKWRNNGRYSSGKDWFAEDGFFPNYFNQKIKVLFIAREDRNCWNTVKEWFRIFRNDNLSDNGFFGTLLKLLYGIEHGFGIKYEDIPSTTEIARIIGKSDGLSFSIMELSKYGNENFDSAKFDKNLMLKFLEDSHLEKRNFFKEELLILRPDIIITLNLWNLGKKITEYIEQFVLGNLKFDPIKAYGKEAYLNGIILNRKRIPVIDMYHFSKRGKNIKKDFYNPLMNILKSDVFKEKFPKIKVIK